MNKFPTVSLIIATYNWPEALELVLLSVRNQSLLPNEVLIADDGSGEETRKVIASFQKNFPVKLTHVWHDDNGFRLAEIRNKAIAKANTEYIVQIDGDIILHKHFIEDHLSNAVPGYYVTGSRVLLDEKTTLQGQKDKRIHFNFFSKGIKNRMNAIHAPMLSYFFQKRTKDMHQAIHKIRGCNMAFWREDLIAINGYNEDLVGWGREDSELSVRMINNGKAKKRIKFGAIQFHQYHQENSKKGLNKNEGILADTIKDKIVKCKNGLNNHL